VERARAKGGGTLKKKIIAAAFVALGIGGVVAGSAPMASADGPLGKLLSIRINPNSPPCLRVDVVIGGTNIGPLDKPVCI
jgi:hypothetical protein